MHEFWHTETTFWLRELDVGYERLPDYTAARDGQTSAASVNPPGRRFVRRKRERG